MKFAKVRPHGSKKTFEIEVPEGIYVQPHQALWVVNVKDATSISDPITDWMSENQELLRQYAGKYIAVLLPEGIIAMGESLNDVYNSVKNTRSRDLDDVCFDRVPL